jgi:hypothetical protein
MTKSGLKRPKQLNGYKKMIHNEMFKVDYETLLQQHIECKYIEYYSNTGKHPNIGEYLSAFSNTGKHPNIEEYFTAIAEKYKGMTFLEVLQLYKETYKI